ncbi:MAG: dethiobiotin synthase [Rickettsiales bacterium]|nr:dethiobiotin synthase [Rickettsiales bacterium]
MKIFITSTGTNIGKTYISCLLIDYIKNIKQQKIHAIKPIISGFKFEETPNDLYNLCNSLGLKYSKNNLKKITRYFFEKPLSPDMAARISNIEEAKIDEIIKFIQKIEAEEKNDYLIIEGAGGAFVPINKTENTSDLIAKTAEKIVLVVGSYLGSLSHTISCVHAMKTLNIQPDLIIISQNLDAKNELFIKESETIKSLENFIDIPIISVGKNKKFSQKNQKIIDEYIL